MGSPAIANDVWQVRWNGVKQHLLALKGELDNVGSVPRKVVMIHLINGLLDYGQQQFDFFFNGLNTGEFIPKFIDVHRPLDDQEVSLSREYILRQVIERVATDARVISQAAQQRMFFKNSTEGLAIVATLKKADELAYAAIEPALKNGVLTGKWTALTYFMRDAQVRVIPYANVVLVGIPLTCVQEPRDFLAISHEVGHSVYWNALADADPQRKMWREIEHSIVGVRSGKPIIWLQKWAEEIFADVYGALIAGPSVSLSFQQIAEEDDEHQFEEDDGHHPTPLARAHVYFRALKHSGASETVIKKLVERWRTILKSRAYHNAAPITPADSDAAISDLWSLMDPELRFDVWDDYERMDPQFSHTETADSLIKGLNRVLDIILAQLGDLNADNSPIASLWGHNPLTAAGKAFTAIDTPLDTVAQDVTVNLDDILAGQSWETWARQLHSQYNDLLTADPKSLYKKWLAILRADGWTTEGPHGRPNENQ